jgi:hypothetical protein
LLEFSEAKKALKASPVQELKVELPQAGCRRQCGFGFIASDPGQVNNFARNTALFYFSIHCIIWFSTRSCCANYLFKSVCDIFLSLRCRLKTENQSLTALYAPNDMPAAGATLNSVGPQPLNMPLRTKS